MARLVVTSILALVVLLVGGWLFATSHPDLGVALMAGAGLVLTGVRP